VAAAASAGSIAIALAEHGADVALRRRKPEALAEAVARCRPPGGAPRGATNVRRIEELRALVDKTVAELGRVDILVNNAGTTPCTARCRRSTSARSTVIMDTNVKSIHFLSNFAREAMLRHSEGGSIINRELGRRPFLASDVIGATRLSRPR